MPEIQSSAASGISELNLRRNILGFDFGLKRIGIAIGQLITATATPLAVIHAKQGTPEWHVIDKIIQEWQPCALVVGLPLNMDGTPQSITLKAQQFAQQLQRYSLPIYMADERLTTRAAREEIFAQGGYRALQNKRADDVAAQIILQEWLNIEKNSSNI